jgi:cardiolipin synthase
VPVAKRETKRRVPREPQTPDTLRELYDRASTRASGAPLIPGNAVRILHDARENFPAWLAAIRDAQHTILFENYLFKDDDVGREFVAALAAKAREGVRVRLIYDWFGSRGAGGLWGDLRAAGAEVRVFNPFRLDSPLGWLSRDHRKTITIDGRVGFVSGVCLSAEWWGDPGRRLEPWRDTGIEIRGPAVWSLQQAFAATWIAAGSTPLDVDAMDLPDDDDRAGDIAVRVIPSVPNIASLFRLDQLIATTAREYLWLTDAYFVGLSPYVQALCAAARDGVDVRLLVPGASDIPALRPLSRAGYRPLLAAGVRVFEWNGTMLHAKTAVADGVWSRVGTTNLNFASWIHNWELDVAIENAGFAAEMAAMYEQDLANSTEIVLTINNRVRQTEEAPPRPKARHAASGSANRAAAGALSVGSALGAALTNRRLLGPAEAGLLMYLAWIAVAIAVAGFVWPHLLAIPIAILATWLAIAMFGKAWSLRTRRAEGSPEEAATRTERRGEQAE